MRQRCWRSVRVGHKMAQTLLCISICLLRTKVMVASCVHLVRSVNWTPSLNPTRAQGNEIGVWVLSLVLSLPWALLSKERLKDYVYICFCNHPAYDCDSKAEIYREERTACRISNSVEKPVLLLQSRVMQCLDTSRKNNNLGRLSWFCRFIGCWRKAEIIQMHLQCLDFLLPVDAKIGNKNESESETAAVCWNWGIFRNVKKCHKCS